MNRGWFVVLAVLWATGLLGGRDLLAAEAVTVDLSKWTPPNIATIGDDPFGRLVKYGYALFTDTANEIGPSASVRPNVLQATILPAKIATYRRELSLMPCH
jgi:cytochrome c